MGALFMVAAVHLELIDIGPAYRCSGLGSEGVRCIGSPTAATFNVTSPDHAIEAATFAFAGWCDPGEASAAQAFNAGLTVEFHHVDGDGFIRVRVR